MSGLICLDFNDWIEEYKPIIKDPCNVGRSYSWESEDYSLETYGHELQCLRFMFAFFPDHVWTYIDDGEEGFVNEGYHYVNRMYYYVTEVPAIPNVSYEIV